MTFAPPGGAYLASGSQDDCVRLWYARGQLEDAPLFGPPLGGNGVSEIAVSPDGKTIAVAGSHGSVFVWDLITSPRKCREMKFEHRRRQSGLVFSPNGKMLLSGSSDNTVRVCLVKSGWQQRTFKGHTDNFHCVAWSAAEDYVDSASDDGSICLWKIGDLWDLQEAEQTAVLEEAHGGMCAKAVAFSPDGQYLVSGGNDKRVAVWERKIGKTWEHKHTLAGHENVILSVLVSREKRSSHPSGSIGFILGCGILRNRPSMS